MSLEAGVVIGVGARVLMWHAPKNRSAGYIPDSRDLWDCFWEHRAELDGFAHSHPGRGRPSPSYEDLTTFIAVEAALGKQLRWWITSEDTLVEVTNIKTGETALYNEAPGEEPQWLGQLRQLSYEEE